MTTSEIEKNYKMLGTGTIVRVVKPTFNVLISIICHYLASGVGVFVDKMAAMTMMEERRKTPPSAGDDIQWTSSERDAVCNSSTALNDTTDQAPDDWQPEEHVAEKVNNRL